MTWKAFKLRWFAFWWGVSHPFAGDLETYAYCLNLAKRIYYDN